jgi:iron complex outermembrane receptor protein
MATVFYSMRLSPFAPRLAAGAITVAVIAVTPLGVGAQSCGGTCPLVLDPIDVRVTRSQVPADRVPFAITVLARQSATQASATSAAEALRGAPGVQVANRYNDAVGERITIRGQGARAQFGIRGIRVLVDGIPATMPDGQTTLTHLDAAQVFRTQVLRGPAGALWGNASGGVVELQTVPDPDGTWFGADADAGAFGLRRASLSGASGAGYGASVFGRFTAQQFTGFRAHSLSTRRLAAGGAAWRDSTNRVWMTGHAVQYDADNPGSLSQSQLDSARFQANPNNVRQKTGENGSHVEVGAGWTHWMRGSLLEVSAYGIHRDLTNPIPPTIIDLTRSVAGARAVFTSPATAHVSITTGAETAIQLDDRENHVNTLGTRGALTLDQAERVRYIAPFAQVLLGLNANIDALVGARYDAYRFHARDRLISAQDPDDSGTRSMNAPSATAGIRARIGNASIYGNYATSFQTPTTTELANRPDGAGGFNPSLDPERTHGGEVGVAYRKGDTELEAAAYIAKVRDALIGFEVPDAPSRQYFRNAGSVTNKGAEAGARFYSRYTSMRASVSVIDSRFDDYTVGAVSYAGNYVPGVAKWSGDASLTLKPGEMTWVQVDARHSSAVLADDANTARAPGYTVVDASIDAWGFRVGSLDLFGTLGVSNLADVAYITSVSINAAGSRYYEPGPGRALFVRISATH